MNRRTLFKKAVLLAVAAPLAASSSIAVADAAPKSVSDILLSKIHVEPYPLSEGVAPPPSARVSYTGQFQVLRDIPYRVYFERSSAPSKVDPLGNYGFLAYKYIWKGEYYGNYILLDTVTLDSLSDTQLENLGRSLIIEELKTRTNEHFTLVPVDTFYQYVTH